MRLTVEKIERATDRIERQADFIDRMTGKVCRVIVVVVMATQTVHFLRNAVENAPIPLLGIENSWWLWLIAVVPAAMVTWDVAVNGIRDRQVS
jgi:hypothetical protein